MVGSAVISRGKVASSVLRGAVVSGLTAGLTAAALGGGGMANASCVSVGGFFSLGSGCTSTPLSIALVLGNGTATAQGLLTTAFAIGNATYANASGFLTTAIANGLGNTTAGPTPPETDVRSAGALSLAYGGGTDIIVRTNGNLNLAVALGDRYFVKAGGTSSDIGNVALGLGFGRSSDPNELGAVVAGIIAPNGPASFFNFALNLGNTGNVQAQGFANSVLNFFGNQSGLAAIGMFNNATNFFGDDNNLIASNVVDKTANILRQIGGNVAFNFFGNNNNFTAGSEPCRRAARCRSLAGSAPTVRPSTSRARVSPSRPGEIPPTPAPLSSPPAAPVSPPRAKGRAYDVRRRYCRKHWQPVERVTAKSRQAGQLPEQFAEQEDQWHRQERHQWARQAHPRQQVTTSTVA